MHCMSSPLLYLIFLSDIRLSESVPDQHEAISFRIRSQIDKQDYLVKTGTGFLCLWPPELRILWHLFLPLTQKKDSVSVATFVHLTTATTLSLSMMSIYRTWFRSRPHLLCPLLACPCLRSLSRPRPLGYLPCRRTASRHHQASSPCLVSSTNTLQLTWQHLEIFVVLLKMSSNASWVLFLTFVNV